MAAPLLLVCDFNAHGGTQTQVLELLAAIDRARLAPRLCTLNLDDALRRRLEEIGVPVTNLGLRGAWRAGTITAVSGLARLIRKEGVRLVHGFLLQGNVVAAVAGRRAGVPYITSVRNLDLLRRPMETAASRWAHAGAAAVTFNSMHVREITSGREAIPWEKTRVIYNGLPAAPNGPVSGSLPAGWAAPGVSPRLICVASLFAKKGHRHLLEAFALVLRKHPRAGLLLAGQGPEEGRLAALAQSLGLVGNLFFAGYRPDARALIAASDLLVLSSIEEGMPNVLLEAMAAGVPQVATTVGGCPEVIDEGVTGRLVPPRDPALMAERIDALLRDAALRQRMSSASRERFARLFTAARMAREHEALYDEVLGAGGGA